MNNVNFGKGGLFINDFHRMNSMAAQREVQQMSLHPCSQERKLAQIARIRQHSATFKESTQKQSDISDMHDENVIRSNKSNIIFVVDCDIRINTPELGQGETREISNKVVLVTNTIA